MQIMKYETETIPLGEVVDQTRGLTSRDANRYWREFD